MNTYRKLCAALDRVDMGETMFKLECGLTLDTREIERLARLEKFRFDEQRSRNAAIVRQQRDKLAK
jgi:hypothetical protein